MFFVTMNQAAAGGRNKVRDGFRFGHAVTLEESPGSAGHDAG
ncbi:hypothetical protein FACS189485_22310 [Spirochaetia bacterium]|nr:hypothetical protein FACS189485_22310 [Spirochaetia bacterium]